MTMLKGKTILITGGSSGIGLELATQLLKCGNKVIVCGRSLEKLDEARSKVPKILVVQADVSHEKDRKRLLAFLVDHPCDVLINNAAIAYKGSFLEDEDVVSKMEEEIAINFTGPVALTRMFYDAFAHRPRLVIINITTGLIYAPRAIYPFYNATKAALHAFTRVLRHQASPTGLRVVEVMMPVVATPWHKGDIPKIAISAEEAVSSMLKSLSRGGDEIRVGKTKLLYVLSRISPSLAFQMINRIS